MLEREAAAGASARSAGRASSSEQKCSELFETDPFASLAAAAVKPSSPRKRIVPLKVPRSSVCVSRPQPLPLLRWMVWEERKCSAMRPKRPRLARTRCAVTVPGTSYSASAPPRARAVTSTVPANASIERW